MKTNYQLSVSTPFGKCQIQADSLEHLAKLAPSALAGSLGYPQLSAEDPLVEQLLDEYRAMLTAEGRNSHLSSLSRQKCVSDAIRCYIDNMTVEQATAWIKKNRQCRVSQSSIGRMWADLSKLPSAGNRHK